VPDPLTGRDRERGAVAGEWLRRIDIGATASKARAAGQRLGAKSMRAVRALATDNRRKKFAAALLAAAARTRETTGRARSVSAALARRLKAGNPAARVGDFAHRLTGRVARSSLARAASGNRYLRQLIELVVGHKFAALFVALAILPYLLSYSQQEIAVLLVINVLLVSSYRLLTLTGEWSLGHVVMMGVGAYASALLARWAGLAVPVAMLAGGGVAGLTAAILSFPLFRMKGFYFLIGSFAAGEIIRLIWKRFTYPFGGPKGLKRIDSVPNLDIGALNVDFYEPVNSYFLALGVVSVSLLILYRIERSRIGLTFHAIHWQDKLAESVGVDTFRYRTLAFVIASFFAGISGALYAHYVGAVSPTRFDVGQMIFVLVWAIVGGTATFYGPIMGAVILTAINEMILRDLGVDTLRPMIYGAILIASVLFLPHGLESLVPRTRAWLAGLRSGSRET